MKKGIDVSHHQGVIDWARVAASGEVEFAILRASFGWGNPAQIDRRVQNNIAGCTAAGIPYGFYHYSYAKTPDEAREEAKLFLSAVAGSKPQYPLALDFEDPSQMSLTGAEMRAVCRAFLEAVEAAGYAPMLYSTASLLEGPLTLVPLITTNCR